MVNNKAYCSCGSVTVIERRSVDRGDKKSAFFLFFISLLIGAGVVHFIHWDKFSLTILPLKLKQFSKSATGNDLIQIAAICKFREKTQCRTQTLLEAFQLEPNRTEILGEVADIYFQNKDFEKAIPYYKEYLSKVSFSPEAHFNYAKALELSGDIGRAKRQYAYILRRDRKDPQFITAKSYVDILLKENQYEVARDIIIEYRKSSKQSMYFLEKEWQLITRRLGDRKIASKRQ